MLFSESAVAIVVRTQICSYVYCAAITAWCWDFLVALDEELKVFSQPRLTGAQIVYLCARLFTFATLLLCVLLQLRSIHDCNSLSTSIGIIVSVAQSANSLLMLLRLIAVYYNYRNISICFGVLWLGGMGASLATASLAFYGSDIEFIAECAITDVREDSAAGIIINTVADTLMYLAITYRLLTFHSHASRADWLRVRNALTGKDVNYVSDLLLYTGQHYYGMMITVSLATIVTLMLPSIPTDTRAILAGPYIAWQNAMVSKVHRQLKLGILAMFPSDLPSVMHSTSMHFTSPNPGADSVPHNQCASHSDASDVQLLNTDQSAL